MQQSRCPFLTSSPATTLYYHHSTKPTLLLICMDRVARRDTHYTIVQLRFVCHYKLHNKIYSGESYRRTAILQDRALKNCEYLPTYKYNYVIYINNQYCNTYHHFVLISRLEYAVNLPFSSKNIQSSVNPPSDNISITYNLRECVLKLRKSPPPVHLKTL